MITIHIKNLYIYILLKEKHLLSRSAVLNLLISTLNIYFSPIIKDGNYLRYFRRSVKMTWAVPWLMPNMNGMSSTVHRQSFMTAASTAAMTRWDCPGWLLYLNDTQLSWNRLFHSSTYACDTLFLPYTAEIRAWISLPETPYSIKKCTTPGCLSLLAFIVMSNAHMTRSLHFKCV